MPATAFSSVMLFVVTDAAAATAATAADTVVVVPNEETEAPLRLAVIERRRKELLHAVQATLAVKLPAAHVPLIFVRVRVAKLPAMAEQSEPQNE